MSKKLRDWLLSVGLKRTKPRLLVLDILHKNEHFMSADDIFVKAKKVDKSISLSTVYRILESFVEKEIVSPVTLEYSKHLLYELKHETHAHHLICLSCKKVIHVHNCPLESFEKQMGDQYDFKVKNHKLEFYGLCSACQAKENAS